MQAGRRRVTRSMREGDRSFNTSGIHPPVRKQNLWHRFSLVKSRGRYFGAASKQRQCLSDRDLSPVKINLNTYLQSACSTLLCSAGGSAASARGSQALKYVCSSSVWRVDEQGRAGRTQDVMLRAPATGHVCGAATCPLCGARRVERKSHSVF